MLVQSPEVTIKLMGSLVDKIRAAVDDERFVVSWHADERCEERGVTVWQLVVGLREAKLV